MRDRLIELLQAMPYLDVLYGTQEEWESVADHLLASGVIVPPCKVGNDVYYIIDGKIQALSVEYGTFVGKNITMSARCKDESDMCEAGCWLDGKTCGIGFYYSHIGKTVFLTEEEAEQALKEREQSDR